MPYTQPQQKFIIIVIVKVFVRFVEAGHYPNLPAINYGNQSGLEFAEIYCLRFLSAELKV